jgi:hypothetical protein
VAVTNEEEFKAWLEGQPREVCVAIAYRAALRVLPLWTDIDRKGFAESLHLANLRAVLTAGVAVLNPDSVRRIAEVVASEAVAYGDYPAYAACSAAAQDTAKDAAAEAALVLDVIQRSGDAPADADSSLAAIFCDTELPARSLLITPIVVHEVMRETIQRRTQAPGYPLSLRGPWAFWATWYDRAMAGDPLPWDLQEQIALIPNEIWETGPEAVAKEIERIEAEFELRHRIADFEADQAQLERKRFGIGGNNPPVEIDDPETCAQVVVIWESIAGLKEEVNAEKPDAKRVATLIERLSAALRVVFVWCGRKMDLAVDTTIKWGIPAAAGGYFYANPYKAEAVLKAAQDWLPFLAP